MAATAQTCNFGWLAPGFELPATNGTTVSLDAAKGERGTVVVFMCNHCPYVKAILQKLIRDAEDLAKLGVSTIAISSNDASRYPEDSFANMKRLSEEAKFPFPYLYDETQGVARAYGAVCTPEFFGFNADLELQYRGRLDESRSTPTPDTVRRDLFEAMKLVAETGNGPQEQVQSMGCSIKWKE